METPAHNWTVISLGGSLLYPDRIDGDYIKRFVELIEARIKTGARFALITGGGKLCRDANDVLKAIRPVTNEDLDWMGIYTTRWNASVVRMAFGENAEPVIFQDPSDVTLTGKSVLVGGGYKPGHSSDGAAVVLAKTLGATKLINLSNIDYVYTADPRKDPNATKIEKIAWPEFRQLLPKEWNPGASAPFDPVAAEMAEAMHLEVAVMNGNNLENLGAYLDGKEFQGTVIS